MREIFKYISFGSLLVAIFSVPFGFQTQNYFWGVFLLFLVLSIKDFRVFSLKSENKYEKYFVVFLLLYLAIDLLSVIWSDDKNHGFYLFYKYIFLAVLPYFLFVASKAGVIKSKNLLFASFLLGVASMTICCYYWAFYNSIYDLDNLESYPNLAKESINNSKNSPKKNTYNLLCNNFDSLLVDNSNCKNDRLIIDSLTLAPKDSITFGIYTKKLEDNSISNFNVTLLNNYTNYSLCFHIDAKNDSLGKWIFHKKTIVNNKDSIIVINQFNWNFYAKDSSKFLISKPMLCYGEIEDYCKNPFDSIYEKYYRTIIIKNHFQGQSGIVFEPVKMYYWKYKFDNFWDNFNGCFTNFTYTNFSHFGHPSYIGFFVLFVLIVLMYILFFIKHKFLYILFYLGQILYFVLFLFLIQSRTNLIAFLVVAFAFGIIVIFRQRKIFKSLIFALVIVVSFLAFMRAERFSFAINNFKEGNYQESNARVGIWLKSIESIKEKPILGYGLGDCDKIWKNWFQEGNASMDYTHAHNQFLQAWLESGFLGFLFLSLAFVSVIVYAFKKKNYILILFWIIVIINLCFECMFMYHKGVTSVTPLIYLFLMKNPKNIVEK